MGGRCDVTIRTSTPSGRTRVACWMTSTMTWEPMTWFCTTMTSWGSTRGTCGSRNFPRWPRKGTPLHISSWESSGTEGGNSARDLHFRVLPRLEKKLSCPCKGSACRWSRCYATRRRVAMTSGFETMTSRTEASSCQSWSLLWRHSSEWSFCRWASWGRRFHPRAPPPVCFSP